MKIPFLILCLAVVYGVCQTYGHEENIDLTEETQNGDYKLNYADMPLEKLLSRRRRSLLPIPIPIPTIVPNISNIMSTMLQTLGINKVITTAVSTAISTVTDSMKFMFGALMGQDCPTVKISFALIPQSVCHPITTMKTIVCYIFQKIGAQSRGAMGKMLDLSITFFKNVFLPGMHTTLNKLNGTGLLPPQISAMIIAFNAVYSLLQLLGYVPK